MTRMTRTDGPRRRAALALAGGLVFAAPAQAVTYGFCWQGEADYRIEGVIAYPDNMRGLVTERDVTAFIITGWRDDAYLGRWSAEDATPETSWMLRFDADALAFRMGGYVEDNSYQQWNADGTATDCGTPGFGFNGGNRAQDVCVDGTFIDESGVPPDTPLAISASVEDPCGPVPMSALPRPRRTG
ncbi:hypothetical protein [uncultured Jannaschia sp.]|uniref:hypothetical protein n=1 Tax=uncultured Jannaschia sp. TaxID=293347 RepID=UPI0026386A4B|nr:hypothetical protein [uncultured Jannaschia sp.]